MSSFPKTVYKITDCGLREHKYVFSGTLPQNIRTILNKVRQPEDVTQLNMSDYLQMNRLSSDWEYKLGIYCYGKYTSILHSSEMVDDNSCQSVLKSLNITSYLAFQRIQKKGTLNAQQINCARRLFKQELEHEMQHYRAKNVHFVELQIRMDDSILAVKNKYFACAEHADYYMRPDWVHMFTTANTILGLSFTDREDPSQPLIMSADPLHELLKFHKESHDSQLFDKFRHKLIAQTMHLDYLLEDSHRVPHLEIQAVDLPFLLKMLARKRPKLLRSVDDLKRAFIYRYFVVDDNNMIYRLLDNPGFALLSESKKNRDAVQKYLQAENESFTLLNTASASDMQTFQSKEHVILCTLEVFSSYKEEVIDLHKIYEFLAVTDNVLLVSYRGPKRSRSDKLQTIVHKVQRIAAVMDDLKQLEGWLDPNDESRKANTLTIKLHIMSANECQVTVVLHPDASYKIIVSWNYSQGASLKHLQYVVEHVKGFLTNLMASIPFQLDRTSNVTLPLPDPHFLTTMTPTVHFKNINLAFSLSNVASFDYEKAKKLAECFFPFIISVGDEANIAKYWKQNPKSQVILQKLRTQGLLDLTKLQKLSSGQWANLDLTGNPKHDMKLRDDFRKYVSRVTGNIITFFYKRHSHFDTINIQRRFIIDYLAAHKMQIHDIFIDDAHARDLIIEMKNRFHVSLQDAQDCIREVADEFEHGIAGNISSGMKCEVRYTSANSCKITVTGLKQYTPTSSVKQLLSHIKDFFQQMWAVYGKNTQVDLKKQTVCSVPQQNAIAIAIDDFPEQANDTNHDTDDFDFDFDLEMPDSKSDANLEAEGQLESALDTISSHTKPGLLAKGDYRLLNLQQADPELFQQKGSQSSYAQKCQKNHMRQPIVLAPQEYLKLNRKAFKTPAASPDGFEYRGKFYICPEIWCRSMRTALTPEELQNAVWSNTDLSDTGKPVPKIVAGTCPDGEPALIANDGIQGWRAHGISQQNPDQGRYQYPGFLKNLHPQGLGVPCCFVNDQSTGDTSSSKFYRQSMLRQYAEQSPKKQLVKSLNSNRKYILDATKFPLEPSRFGRLPPQLHVKLNRNSTEHSRDKIFGDAYRQYLRLGVDQSESPVLSAISTAYNCIADKPKHTLSAFRRHIATHVDDQLLGSLKNGAIKLLFENFPGDDSLSNYREYLVNSSEVDVQLIWDLVSRPHPWLFPSGVNLIVLQMDRKLQLRLVCPQAELASSLYSNSRPALVVLTDQNGSYEVVTLVRGDLSCSPFLSKPTNFAGLDSMIHRCSFITEGPLSPAKLMLRLADAEPGLQPVAQVLTAYNKVNFIVTANGIPIPTEVLGPVHQLQTRHQIVKLDWPKHHKTWTKLSKMFDGVLEPTHAMPDKNGKVAALRLSNGMQLPTTGRLPFSIKITDVYADIDESIFTGQQNQIEDTRVKEASRIRFLTETLERYRSELSNFLLNDLRAKNSKTKYWFQVDNIINGKTLAGEPLPMWAKRSLLYQVLLTDRNPIVKRIVTTEKPVPQQYKPEYTRPACASSKIPSSCNAQQHCCYAGACKLFVPKEYLSRFTLLIIDEILWYTQRRDAMLSNNTQADPPRTNTIRITDNFVEFDNTLAFFVLKLLENRSFRLTKQDMMLDVLSTEGKTHSELIKQHVVYDQIFKEKQTDAIMRAVQLESLDPQSAAQWKGCYMVVSQEKKTPLQVIAVMVSYLTENHAYTEARLRQDFAKMLRELQYKNKPYWKHYLQQSGRVSRDLKHINTLTQLISTILSGYPGSVMDLDLLTRVFPVQLDILDLSRSQTKVRTLTNLATTNRMRVVLKGDAFCMCGCKLDSDSPVQFVFS